MGSKWWKNILERRTMSKKFYFDGDMISGAWPNKKENNKSETDEVVYNTKKEIELKGDFKNYAST